MGAEHRQVFLRNIVGVLHPVQFGSVKVEPVRFLSAGDEMHRAHPRREFLHAAEPVAQKSVVSVALLAGIRFAALFFWRVFVEFRNPLRVAAVHPRDYEVYVENFFHKISRPKKYTFTNALLSDTVTIAVHMGVKMKTFYGYMRVSTKEQNEDRQKIKLAEVGIREENMFLDRQSGKDFERKEWRKVINLLGSDTVLFVTSLDRLGRNYQEIMRQWKIITQEKGADIVVLDMPLLDTRNRRDLLGTLISDLVLTILSYVAETERTFIKTRQAEGIAAARQRGVQFGRPRLNLPTNFLAEKARYESKEITLLQAARNCGMRRTTFWEKVRAQK